MKTKLKKIEEFLEFTRTKKWNWFTWALWKPYKGPQPDPTTLILLGLRINFPSFMVNDTVLFSLLATQNCANESLHWSAHVSHLHSSQVYELIELKKRRRYYLQKIIEMAISRSSLTKEINFMFNQKKNHSNKCIFIENLMQKMCLFCLFYSQVGLQLHFCPLGYNIIVRTAWYGLCTYF